MNEQTSAAGHQYYADGGNYNNSGGSMSRYLP